MTGEPVDRRRKRDPLRVWMAAALVGMISGGGTAVAMDSSVTSQTEAMTGANIEALSLADTVITATNRDGEHFRVTLENGGGLRLEPTTAPPQPEPRAAMLPDGIITHGKRNIRAAWLSGPTERYDHGVLGDAIEASAVSVELASGQQRTLTLDAGSVFEDRLARIADMRGDGNDAILAVRSYIDRGAALAMIEVVGDELKITAESPSIGLPHRWLNPLGTGDFDGDGRIEAVVVQTPHIGGILKFYEIDGTALHLKHAQDGFSSHVMGTRTLDMAAVVDINDDGIPDILVPSDDLRSLRAVTFAGGTFRVLAEVHHDAPIASSLVIHADIDDPRQVAYYALKDGTLIATHFVPR